MKNKKLVQGIKKALLISAFSASITIANDVPITTQTITQQDIINSGLNNLGDIINELVITNGAVLNQFNNNGGNGSTTVNLRVLGSSRVLVFLNGKRMVRSVNGLFDFSSIPLSIIQRVEIGNNNETNTIAGTVNIITRDDFTGIETNAYYGKSSRNDAETQNYNLSIGKKTEKASVFFNAEISKNAPIYAGDRDISALPRYGTGNNYGSAATPQGYFAFFDQDFNFINATTTPGSNGFNTPNDPDLVPFTNDDRYNFAAVNFLLTPQERKSLYVKGKFKINDKVTAYSEVLFNRRESQQKLASSPLFIGLWGNTTTTDEPIGVGSLNPYNPFGYDLIPEYDASGLLFLGRRLIEAGARTTNQRADTYNFNIGLSGSVEFNSTWDWDVSYSRSKKEKIDVSKNYFNIDKVAYALSNECVTDTTCVPLNLFGGEGSITPEMVEYIRASSTKKRSNSVSTFQLSAASTLANLTAGELNIFIGFEHRRLAGYYQPTQDNVTQLYGVRDNIYSQPIDASYQVNEVFVDLEVPLIANKLDLNIHTQYSKYEFTDGDFSGNIGMEYSPIQSIKVNLDYSKLIQPPRLYQLYMEEYRTYPAMNDICVGNSDLPGCDFDLFQYFGNIPAYNEGNENLQNEKSNAFNLNINYKPQAIENLEFNLYANKQKSDNLISLFTAQNLLTACAYTGESIYCDRVIRGSSGYLFEVRPTFLNNDKLERTSIGFDVGYDFSTESASYNIKWQNLYFQNLIFSTRNFIDDTIIEYDLISLENSGTEIPQLKSNLELGMTIKNFSLNYQLRYIAGYEESCNPEFNDLIVATNDPNAVGGVVSEDFLWCTYNSSDPGAVYFPVIPEIFYRRHVGGSTFHDINFKYDFPEFKANIMLGIENVFDKTPPLSSTAFTNSYNTSLYNGTGRYFWVRFSKQF